MPSDAFVARLNEQIANEFGAHHQYVACAVHYDAQTLPQLARFFYAQALEERDHAMMMIQYLIDADADVVIPGVTAPQAQFADIVEPRNHDAAEILPLAQHPRNRELRQTLTPRARDLVQPVGDVVQAALDGDIDDFIESELRRKASATGS